MLDDSTSMSNLMGLFVQADDDLHQRLLLLNQDRLFWIGQFEIQLTENLRLEEQLRAAEDAHRDHNIDLGSIEYGKDNEDSFQLELGYLSRQSREEKSASKHDFELGKQLETERARVVSLVEQLEEAVRRDSTNYEIIKRFEGEVASLEEQLQKQLARSSIYVSDENRLVEEIARLQGIVSDKDQGAMKMKEKIYNLEVRLGELQEECQRKDGDITGLKTTCKQLSVGYEQAKEALQANSSTNQDVMSMAIEPRWLQREAELLGELQRRDNEREDREKTVEALTSQVIQLRSSITEADALNSILDKQLRSSDLQIDSERQRMAIELECAKAEREVYERENQRLQAKCECLRKETDKSVSDEIHQLTQMLEASEKARFKLQQDETDLRRLFEMQRKELERVKGAAAIMEADEQSNKEEHTFGGGGFALNVIPPDTVSSEQLEQMLREGEEEPQMRLHVNSQKTFGLRLPKLMTTEEEKIKNQADYIETMKKSIQSNKMMAAEMEILHKRELLEMKYQLEEVIEELYKARADKLILLDTIVYLEKQIGVNYSPNSDQTPFFKRGSAGGAELELSNPSATVLESVMNERDRFKNEVSSLSQALKESVNNYTQLKEMHDTLQSKNPEGNSSSLYNIIKEKYEEIHSLQYRLNSVFEVLRKKQADTDSLVFNLKQRAFFMKKALKMELSVSEDDDTGLLIMSGTKRTTSFSLANNARSEIEAFSPDPPLNSPQKRLSLSLGVSPNQVSGSDEAEIRQGFEFDHKELLKYNRENQNLTENIVDRLNDQNREADQLKVDKSMLLKKIQALEGSSDMDQSARPHLELELLKAQDDLGRAKAHISTLEFEISTLNSQLYETENEKNKYLEAIMRKEDQLTELKRSLEAAQLDLEREAGPRNSERMMMNRFGSGEASPYQKSPRVLTLPLTSSNLMPVDNSYDSTPSPSFPNSKDKIGSTPPSMVEIRGSHITFTNITAKFGAESDYERPHITSVSLDRDVDHLKKQVSVLQAETEVLKRQLNAAEDELKELKEKKDINQLQSYQDENAGSPTDEAFLAETLGSIKGPSTPSFPGRLESESPPSAKQELIQNQFFGGGQWLHEKTNLLLEKGELLQEKDQLMKEKSKVKEELENARSELDNSIRRIAELEIEVQQKEAELSQFRSDPEKKAKMDHEIQNLREDLKTIDSDLQQSRKDLSQKLDQLHDAETILKLSADKVQELEAKLTEVQSELEKESSRRTNLEKQLDAQKEYLRQAHLELQAARETLAETNTRVADNESHLSRSTFAVSNADEFKQIIPEDSNPTVVRNKIEALLGIVDEKQGVDLQSEIELLKGKLAMKTKQLEKEIEDKNSLEEDLKATEAEKDNSRTKIETLSSRVDELTTLYSQSQQACTMKSTEIQSLKVELTQSQEAYTSKAKLSEELAVLLSQNQEAHSAKTKEADADKKNLETARMQINALNQDFDEAARTMTGLQNDLKFMQQEKKELAGHLDRTLNQKSAREADYMKVSAAHEDLKFQYARKAEELVTVEETNQSLEDRLKNAQFALSKTSQDSGSLSSELSIALSQLEKAKNELETTRSLLKRAQEDLEQETSKQLQIYLDKALQELEKVSLERDSLAETHAKFLDEESKSVTRIAMLTDTLEIAHLDSKNLRESLERTEKNALETRNQNELLKGELEKALLETGRLREALESANKVVLENSNHTNQFSAQLQTLTIQRDTLSAALDSANNLALEVGMKVEGLTRQLEESDLETKNLRETHEASRTVVTATSTKLEDLKSELEAIILERESLKQVVEAITKDVREGQSRIDQLSKQLVSSVAERESLKVALEESKKAALMNMNEQYTAHLEAADLERENLRQALDAGKKELFELRNQTDQLVRQLNASNNESEVLKVALESAERIALESRNQTDHVTAQIQAIETQNNALNAALDSANKRAAEAASKVEGFSKQLESAVLDRDNLREALEISKQAAVDYKAEMESIRAELEALTLEKMSVSEAVRGSKRDARESQSLLDQLRKQLELSISERESLKEANKKAALASANDQYTAHLEAADLEKENLRQLLETSKKAEAVATAGLDRLKAELEAIVLERNRVLEDCESSRKANLQANKKNQQLEIEVENLTQQKGNLLTRLSAAAADRDAALSQHQETIKELELIKSDLLRSMNSAHDIQSQLDAAKKMADEATKAGEVALEERKEAFDKLEQEMMKNINNIKEISDLKAKLALAQGGLNDLSDSVGVASAERDNAITQSNKLSQQLKWAEEELKKSKGELQKIYGELAEAVSGIACLEPALESERQNSSRLASQLMDAENELSRLKAELCVQKMELEELVSALQAQKSHEEQRYQDTNFDSVKDRGFESNARYYSRESRGVPHSPERLTSSPQEAISDYQGTETRSLQVKIDTLVQNCKDMEKAFRSCYLQLVDTDSSIPQEGSNDLRSELSMAILKLKDYVTRLEGQIATYEAERSNFYKLHKQLEEDLKEAKMDYAITLEDKNKADKTIDLQEKTLSEMIDEIESLKREHKSRSNSPNKQIEELQEVVHSLEQEVDNKTKTIKVFFREIAAFQDMLSSDPDRDAPVELALGILEDILKAIDPEHATKPRPKKTKQSERINEVIPMDSLEVNLPLFKNKNQTKTADLSSNIEDDHEDAIAPYFGAGKITYPPKDSHLRTPSLPGKSRTQATINLESTETLDGQQKTVKQLTDEIAKLRQRVTDLSKRQGNTSEKKGRSHSDAMLGKDKQIPTMLAEVGSPSHSRQDSATKDQYRSPSRGTTNGKLQKMLHFDSSVDLILKRADESSMFNDTFAKPPASSKNLFGNSTKKGSAAKSHSDLLQEEKESYKQALYHYRQQLEGLGKYVMQLRGDNERLIGKLDETERRLDAQTRVALDLAEEIKLHKKSIKELKVANKMRDKDAVHDVSTRDKLTMTNRELASEVVKLRAANNVLSKSLRDKSPGALSSTKRSISPLQKTTTATTTNGDTFKQPRQPSNNSAMKIKSQDKVDHKVNSKVERGLSSIHIKLMEFINKSYVSTNKEAVSLHRDLTTRLKMVDLMVERLRFVVANPNSPEPALLGGTGRDVTANRGQPNGPTSQQQSQPVSQRLITPVTTVHHTPAAEDKLTRTRVGYEMTAQLQSRSDEKLSSEAIESKDLQEVLKVYRDTADELKHVMQQAQQFGETYTLLDDSALRLVKIVNAKPKNNPQTVLKLKEFIRHSESERAASKTDFLLREARKVKEKTLLLLGKCLETGKKQLDELKQMVTDRRIKLGQIAAACGEPMESLMATSHSTNPLGGTAGK